MLLLVLAIFGVTGLVAASLELQMSGNLQYQERAFQAAEFAIEQAINSADLSTAYTIASAKAVPLSGMNPTIPGSSSDDYSYRLYYDTSAGSTPIPTGADASTTSVAYHFVISATGRSARGAEDTHVQGFYVLGPTGCDLANATCTFDNATRTKTYWTQQSAE
jgi:type II secretory pathway pseudopilin PulG